MVCGVSALGDRDRPEGGVGRSAHQMTYYPGIDLLFFFIADSLDSLTQGNWAIARAHVPAFVVHRLGGGRLWGRSPAGMKIALRPQVTGTCWA